MNLRYLLDEQLRGRFWRAIERHNRRSISAIDVIRVGDPADLPLGTSDPDILLWAEREGRILVSEDWATMLTHLLSHLSAGHHTPGLFLLRPQVPVVDLIEFLVAPSYASEASEWVDVWRYIP
jgi:hypothetical protein